MFSTLNKLSETSENAAFDLQEIKDKKALFFFFFECVINVAIFDAGKDATFSRSDYFKTLENKRLLGHVVKRLQSPSLMSCSHSCLRNTLCTSTDFNLFSENNNKRTHLSSRRRIHWQQLQWAPRTNIGAFFRSKWRLLCLLPLKSFSQRTHFWKLLNILGYSSVLVGE